MNPHSSDRIVRVFCGTDITESDRRYIATSFKATAPGSAIFFNESGKADMVVVLNFDPALHWIICPSDNVIKWLTEPVVYGVLSRRFSTHHSKKFNRIYSPYLTSDIREIETPPLFPPRLSDDFVKRYCTSVRPFKPEKTKLLSTVTSTLSHLEGHLRRNQLITRLGNDSRIEIDVYGRGRKEVSNKEDALKEYMFSLCVENSFQGSYWSEKISDSFLCMTVPVYVGAKNLSQFFPPESFIDASNLGDEEIADLIAGLSEDDYLARLPYLELARSKVVSDYNLGNKFAALLEESSSVERSSFSLTTTLDTVISFAFFLLERIPLQRQGLALLRKLTA